MSGMGHIFDDLTVEWDDLDEQTKRELMAGGFGPDPAPRGAAKSPDPRCRWCGGTGRVKLLVSVSDCDCVR